MDNLHLRDKWFMDKRTKTADEMIALQGQHLGLQQWPRSMGRSNLRHLALSLKSCLLSMAKIFVILLQTAWIETEMYPNKHCNICCVAPDVLSARCLLHPKNHHQTQSCAATWPWCRWYSYLISMSRFCISLGTLNNLGSLTCPIYHKIWGS